MKITSMILTAALIMGSTAGMAGANETNDFPAMGEDNNQEMSAGTQVITADAYDQEGIEDALNLANVNPEWTYSEEAGAWTMGIVTAVANAQLPDCQGVSVCVPGVYVKGVDTDGDGTQDARHWDQYVLKVFEENADTLSKLFD